MTIQNVRYIYDYLSFFFSYKVQISISFICWWCWWTEKINEISESVNEKRNIQISFFKKRNLKMIKESKVINKMKLQIQIQVQLNHTKTEKKDNSYNY